MRALRLLPLLALAGCALGDVTDDREFCIKVFAEGSAPPAECNGREPSGSLTPTVSVTVKQGTSKLMLLQTVLVDGAQGVASITVAGQPGGGLTITAANNQVSIPGSLLLTVSASANATLAGYNVKYAVGDGNADHEFVLSILVTQ